VAPMALERAHLPMAAVEMVAVEMVMCLIGPNCPNHCRREGREGLSPPSPPPPPACSENKVLAWPKLCPLARAFQWEHN
jgi:hypothetical protein